MENKTLTNNELSNVAGGIVLLQIINFASKR